MSDQELKALAEKIIAFNLITMMTKSISLKNV